MRAVALITLPASIDGESQCERKVGSRTRLIAVAVITVTIGVSGVSFVVGHASEGRKSSVTCITCNIKASGGLDHIATKAKA